MDTSIYRLSADYTVDEYELIQPPKENHLREDQVNHLLDDSCVYSLRTVPILRSRKEMTDEEFELDKQHTLKFFDQYIPYHFSVFAAEHARFYNAYCWSLYKEKKKVMLEPSYVEKLLIDWRFAIHNGSEENEQTEEGKKSSTEVAKEEMVSTEQTEENTSHCIHVFDEEQMKLRLQMYEDAIYARHAEYYYEQQGELPKPEFIMESTKTKVQKELSIIKRFIAIGQQCNELEERLTTDDCFFSFEEDKFVFFYGKSIYKFTIKEDDFYLKGEKVDLPSFFKNLRNECKRIWKHTIRLGKLFERKGISYCNSKAEHLFYLYRVVDEQDVFYLRYKQAEMTILWDKRNFYRMNGAKIEIPAILVHEMIERDGSRKKAQLKAKQYFQMFLTKEEKEMFVKTKSVLVKGKHYEYIFCPEVTVNSVIRIDKTTGEKKSMCVMFDDPYIPRYDVIASALLMVKTGQEEQLNRIANAFDCGEQHHNVLKKFALV